MKTVFIGHFAPISQALQEASSAAGNQVQRKIIKELSLKCGTDNVSSFSMTPQSAWPRGSLICHSHQEGSIAFPGYLNLPILKNIVFSFWLLAYLIKVRPQLCIQYNSYFFENLTVLLYRLCRPSCVLVIFIQDIHVIPKVALLTKRGLRSFSEKASLWLARRFNFIVPISKAIIEDFRMDHGKCFVFQGGLMDFAEKLINESVQQSLLDIGVYAGALEPHNGIDRLVDQWIACDIQWPLHVFGRGSLREHVKLAAERSNKIVFHDIQPESVVVEWQSKARWNFCLRYSSGLDQRYFFPSKLFNIVCSSGDVLVNDFHGLPDVLRKYLCVLPDDLSDLRAQLAISVEFTHHEQVRMRHRVAREQFRWKTCIERIFGNL